MNLPSKVFVTGVPGSKWSSITHEFEKLDGTNHSDQSPERTYEPVRAAGYAPNKWSTGAMHRGSYFGKGMEFEPVLDEAYIDSAWAQPGGCKIVKSHDWAYMLDEIVEKFPSEWIMLIYRPNEVSHWWWCEHGGFNITYAKYHAYGNHTNMAKQIAVQNDNILKFAHKHDLAWGYFTERWVEEMFGQRITIDRPRDQWNDILVSMYKGG